jgi:hypothetical protein
MAQDERRAIFEERSGHIAKSMPYLPAIGRRLHHRPRPWRAVRLPHLVRVRAAARRASEELLAELRASEEWRPVEREVDIRLVRAS